MTTNVFSALPVAGDNTGWANYSLRQFMNVSTGGLGQVAVTFASGASSGLKINNASIAVLGTATAPNTQATPTPLTFGGLSGYTIAGASQTVQSDFVTFSFLSTDQLCVVIDFGSTTSATDGVAAPTNFVEAYDKASSATYNQATVSGFSSNSTCFGIARIDTQAIPTFPTSGGYFFEFPHPPAYFRLPEFIFPNLVAQPSIIRPPIYSFHPPLPKPAEVYVAWNSLPALLNKLNRTFAPTEYIVNYRHPPAYYRPPEFIFPVRFEEYANVSLPPGQRLVEVHRISPKGNPEWTAPNGFLLNVLYPNIPIITPVGPFIRNADYVLAQIRQSGYTLTQIRSLNYVLQQIRQGLPILDK